MDKTFRESGPWEAFAVDPAQSVEIRERCNPDCRVVLDIQATYLSRLCHSRNSGLGLSASAIGRVISVPLKDRYSWPLSNSLWRRWLTSTFIWGVTVR